MNREQGLEVQAQGGIIRTSRSQIGGALAGGQLQGRAKEGHFAIGWGAHGLMNTIRKLQAPSSKLQGNLKFQAPRNPTLAKLASGWSFRIGASLELGVWCLVLSHWCFPGVWCLALLVR